LRAVIFSAGQVTDYGRIRTFVGEPDLVLCADGGGRHAVALGVTPDLVLGDFDSIAPDLLQDVARRGIPIVRVPVEKDLTDTELALREAVSRGATSITLVGASGDRLDHTISNVLLLPGLPHEVQVTLVDDKNCVRLLRPGGGLSVAGRAGEYISLLPLTPEATGVTVSGVKWPLSEATLRWGESLGVSNQFIGVSATVSVRTGHLLVISARD